MNKIEYKSQYGQDKWIIEEIFPNKTGGYFVELAAGDGEVVVNLSPLIVNLSPLIGSRLTL